MLDSVLYDLVPENKLLVFHIEAIHFTIIFISFTMVISNRFLVFIW